MPATDGQEALWRHLYTWSHRGSLGRPGFQTVACATELGDDRRRALERLVAAARPPAPAGGRPTLLVQPLSTDRGRSVLSRVEPLGEGPDGRPGNFWAESLVVPDRWLEAADWDLAAAFGSLDWWGQRDLDLEEEGRADAVRWLAAERLPRLAAGPAGRLARLPEIVADPELRLALLETLAWQAEDGGREEPIHVVAAADTEPADLEELVLLLPLLLPVPWRVRRGAGGPGERRCLRLATLGEPGILQRPDLLGVPEAHLEAARRAPGMVADLGGNVPPPAPGDEAARRWARRVEEALAGGRWEEALTAGATGRKARRGPGTTAEGERMTETRKGTAGPGAGNGIEDPLAERAAAWGLREESEGRAAELVRRLRADVDQLLEPIERLVESERRRFRAEVERLRGELEGLVEDARSDLAREADRGLQHLQSEAERRKDVLRRQLETRIETLDRYQEDLLRRLSDEEVRAERRLLEASGLAATAADRPRSRAEEPKGPARRAAGGTASGTPAAAPGAGARETRRSGAAAHRRGVPGYLEALRPAYRWGLLGAAVLLVLVAAYFLLPGGWPGGGAGAGPGGEVAAAGEAGTGGDGRGDAEAEALRARALDRLRQGGTAAEILRAAAAEEELRELAASTHLALRLSGAGLDAATSCVLLQQALSDRLVERRQAPIAVDGRCGQGTSASIAAAAPEVGCGGGDTDSQAACFLNRWFSRGEPPCAAAWPFARPCPWQAAEGRRVLETLRRAGVVERSRYDLAASPALASALAGRELAEEEARDLLPLAYATAVLRADEPLGEVPASGALGRDQLEAALALLDRLAAAGGGPGA